MAELITDLLKLKGRIEGVTFYEKNGKIIVRKAHSKQPRRMSYKQFIQRQRLIHNNALWRKLQDTKQVFFEGCSSACHRFRSINQDVPDVFLTKQMRQHFASLLLPDMVLSDGPLQPINYQLGDVDGQPALFTDLTKAETKKGTLLLYVLMQNVHTQLYSEETPQIDIKVETITSDMFTIVPSTLTIPFPSKSGTLALVDDRFGDPMLGFGLVHVIDGHASHQRVVTRCTYYEKYTTEEALQTAATSYGGLTKKSSHSPR